MISKTFKLVTICLLSTAAATHHHHHDRRLGSSNNAAFSWGQNAASKNNVIAQGSANTGGVGGSSISAGMNGTVLTAFGTNGASANTLFGQNSAASNSAFGINAYGNDAGDSFGSNAASSNNTFAATNSVGGGQTNIQGAATAQGIISNIMSEKNSSNNGNFVTDINASSNSFGVGNAGYKKRLLGGKNNNNFGGDSFGWNSAFSDVNATKAANSNQTYGAGGSLVSLGKTGVKAENHGSLGTSSKSALQTQQNSWNNNNAWGVSGGKSFGWNAANASNNNSQAFTNAQTFGNGGSVTDANNDGVNMMAQGQDGTTTDAGYNNSSDAWQNNNAWGAQRKLSGRDADCDKDKNNNNNNYYKDLYEKTLEKLRKCRQNCGKVGASQ